ncbi:MAG: transporter substrate-binding domain-containing protein [Clostridiales bacterium]|nr:transporter substrate-binding domain-containing protein [Eubacteriales bacterium]MDH7566043.1 transporter substrate-binding domain-containing protein [Clostridiales bacterium]
MLKLKKVLSILLSAVFVLAMLAGCAQSSNQTSSTQTPSSQKEQGSQNSAAPQQTKPLEGKKLVLAINATFAPFESVKVTPEGKTEFQGIDIDIANSLADKLGFQMEITDMAFAGLIGALTSHRADFVISGISPTKERLNSVDFTTSYFYPSIAIISRKDSPFKTADELNGKKVAVPFGTSYEAKAKAMKGTNVIAIDGSPAVIQELKSKRVDAAVIDGCQAAEFVKQNPELEYHLLPNEHLLEDSFAIATPKNSELTPILDKAIKEMMANGELDKIVAKWLGEDYVKEYKAGK